MMHYVDMAKLYGVRQRENEEAARIGEGPLYSNESMGLLACHIVVKSALAGDVRTAQRFRARMRVHAAMMELARSLEVT